jgi:hypothetical protein
VPTVGRPPILPRFFLALLASFSRRAIPCSVEAAPSRALAGLRRPSAASGPSFPNTGPRFPNTGPRSAGSGGPSASAGEPFQISSRPSASSGEWLAEPGQTLAKLRRSRAGSSRKPAGLPKDPAPSGHSCAEVGRRRAACSRTSGFATCPMKTSSPTLPRCAGKGAPTRGPQGQREMFCRVGSARQRSHRASRCSVRAKRPPSPWSRSHSWRV